MSVVTLESKEDFNIEIFDRIIVTLKDPPISVKYVDFKKRKHIKDDKEFHNLNFINDVNIQQSKKGNKIIYKYTH